MDRLVAIKMLLTDRSPDKETFLRFKQEGKAASQLSHPNIAAVYDFGISPAGQPYMAMDYIHGISLDKMIEEQGAVPTDVAVGIFVQVCDAMAHAHQKGIIHRDLKPSNIMVTAAENGASVVKIVDFGIAKLLYTDGVYAEGTQAQGLTRAGEVFGSPSYMSPEQCQGLRLDNRSDIYSMGCVMYETLTGKLPLTGQNTIETMYQHMNVNPPPFAQVRPDLSIPNYLEDIVFKALAKKPQDRYQSMTELKEDLEHIGKESQPAKLEGFVRPQAAPLEKATPRNRWKTALLAVVLLLLSIGTGLGVLSFIYARGETEVMVRYLGPGDLQYAQGHLADALRMYELGLVRARQIPLGNSCVAIVLDKLGTFYEGQHEFVKAEACFREALDLRTSFVLKDNRYLAENTRNIGRQLALQKRYTEAEPLYKKAKQLYEQASEPDPAKFRDCLRRYAIVLRKLGRSEEAATLDKKADRLEKDTHLPTFNAPDESTQTP